MTNTNDKITNANTDDKNNAKIVHEIVHQNSAKNDNNNDINDKNIDKQLLVNNNTMQQTEVNKFSLFANLPNLVNLTTTTSFIPQIPKPKKEEKKNCSCRIRKSKENKQSTRKKR